jgi:hypothetical protein
MAERVNTPATLRAMHVFPGTPGNLRPNTCKGSSQPVPGNRPLHALFTFLSSNSAGRNALPVTYAKSLGPSPPEMAPVLRGGPASPGTRRYGQKEQPPTTTIRETDMLDCYDLLLIQILDGESPAHPEVIAQRKQAAHMQGQHPESQEGPDTTGGDGRADDEEGPSTPPSPL